MKCIVLKEWDAGGQAKSFPLGVIVPPGTICEVNPYAAKNWLIPAGVLAPLTNENLNNAYNETKK